MDLKYRFPRVVDRRSRSPRGETGGRPPGSTTSLPIACVIGDIHLLRPIAMVGVRCAVVAPPNDVVRHSRFASPALRWIDPISEPDRFVDYLISFARSQPEPPVLFYEWDSELLAISRCRDRVAPAFRFMVADPELVENLVDKGRFQQLAEQLDLPVPPARRLSPATSDLPARLDLRLPAVLKPLSRGSQRWAPIAGHRKALRIDSMEDLRRLWEPLARTNVEIVLQEMVPGPESRIESYHVYVDEHGDIAGEFTGRKIRTYPVESGQSTALLVTDEQDVVELGRTVIRRLNLRGVAKLDFKRAPDGRLFLLEVNPRFSLWHHLGAVAGVNLPGLVYADLVGLHRPPVSRARPGVRWCSPWNDLHAAGELGIPHLQWLAWTIGCQVKGNAAWDDPIPALYVVVDRMRSALHLGKSKQSSA